jgi:hypothetical protein
MVFGGKNGEKQEEKLSENSRSKGIENKKKREKKN